MITEPTKTEWDELVKPLVQRIMAEVDAEVIRQLMEEAGGPPQDLKEFFET